MDGKAFQKSIMEKYPTTKPELTEFPSGSFMIDLFIESEKYVIEYVIGKGFGLSKQAGSGYGWEGVENYFENSDLVESYIGELLSGKLS